MAGSTFPVMGQNFPTSEMSTNPITLLPVGVVGSSWRRRADFEYELSVTSCVDHVTKHNAGNYGSDGKPVAIASATIAGTVWNLYKGPNGSTTVFSFIAENQVSDFDGDLMDFLNYLITNESLPSSQYLLSIGAGKQSPAD
jgi:xyloglucan-specific endo-beta-1,4-glucanase